MRTDINTKGNTYTADLIHFRRIRDSMRPLVKLLDRMTEEQQETWLAKDDMLREFIEMCDRVSVKKNDDA